MTREILFRGKRLDNGEWIKGYLYRISESLNPFIMIQNKNAESHEVDPSTVGQYTGFKDANGKKIFVGDILKWDPAEWGGPYNELVTWDYELFDMRKNDWPDWCEIIGNVHDNPELLK